MTDRQVDLSKFDNSDFPLGAGPLKRTLWYFVNVFFFQNPWFPFRRPKPALLRMFGAEIGKGVVIHPRVSIKFPWKLVVGDHCWIGQKVWIDNIDLFVIGNHVVISQGALILGGDHDYKKVDFPTMAGTITLQNGCWIGARSIVTRNLTVGEHAVLTAGSMTSKDLDPFGIYQGNPAVMVRERQIE